MKIDTKALTSKLLPIIERLKHSTNLVFFLVVALVLGYLLLQINLLSSSEPSSDEVTTKLLEIKRPRVDEKTVKILNDLEDNNTQVQSIFQQARENPFSE